ncbi:Protein TAR1 [Capsicum baccatum]|uniref:Protein TAR1 n=1 Tax=Capsicum baccatum TaxID=33114 RepID=A0A2G2UWR3_CAPBA|nr:Protein TAR1 [Capsicum baccatum]
MIGRADIEGSKSNVAMNAWLPQASYPCGNFSDTSSFEFRRSKGSLGHAFTMCRPSQTPHLTMSSARIGPQSEPWVQKEGQCPASDSRNNRIPLVRTSSELAVRRAGKAPEGTVPSPSPGRHAATRSRRGSSSSSPPTADGFGTGTPVPSPQSQSFSRSYGSILPTSLAYIVPSTRGCSPWRPDAVMSTTGRGRHSVLRIFKGRRERTGHHATCGALPAAGPYLRLSRFQDERFARQYRCEPPPEFPLASPRSGIVHHLSGPDRSVFQDGSNGEPTGQRPERADTESRRRHALPATIEETTFHERIESPGFGRPPIHAGPRPGSIGVPARRRSTYDRGASPAPIRFPPDNFKHSLTLFSKSFSSFPRGTCSLSVSRPYLALDGIHRPIWAAFPNNPTRRQRLVVRQGPGTTGLSPSPAPPSRGLGPGPPLRTLLQTTIRTMELPDSKAGLFPIRSPLLTESLQIAPPTKNGHAPPPIESRKSSQSVNPYYVWTWINQVAFLIDVGVARAWPSRGGADGFKVSATVVCKERRTGQIRADEGPMPATSAASENLDRCSWTTTSHDEPAREGSEGDKGTPRLMHGRRPRRPPALAPNWARPHACSAWSLLREQHLVLAARTKAPHHPKSSASSPVVDDATDNRHERTMKRRRR